MRWSSRPVMWLAVLATPLVLQRAAGAQVYPMLRDSQHRSVAPPYTYQGPGPTSMQDDPRIAPGEPNQTIQGVPNGPPVVTDRSPNGTLPAVVEPPAQHLPMGTAPLLVDPDGLSFHSDVRLPDNVSLALVKALPNGGVEAYMRIPEGGKLPNGWSDVAVDFTFVRGEATLAVDGTPAAADAGSHAFLPALTAHSITCGNQGPCMVFLRSQGPWRVHYVSPYEAPGGAR